MLPQDILNRVRLNMLLIAHHNNIIDDLKKELQELTADYVDPSQGWEIDIETGEVKRVASDE